MIVILPLIALNPERIKFERKDGNLEKQKSHKIYLNQRKPQRSDFDREWRLSKKFKNTGEFEDFRKSKGKNNGKLLVYIQNIKESQLLD